MGVLAVVLIALLVVFFLLAASLLLPARFRFRAKFVNGRLSYDAAVHLPLFPRYFVLPDLARFKKNKRSDDGSQSTVAGEAPPAQDTRAPIQTLRQTLEALHSYYPEIAALASYVARSVTIHEFRVRSRLGTGDAAETALLVGGLRATAGIALGVVRRFGIQFKKRPKVRIMPMYERAYLSAGIEIISSIVPLRGLIAFFRFMRHVRHVRKPKTESRNVVSKAPGWNTRV